MINLLTAQNLVIGKSPQAILAHIRHELRGPINAILGYSEMWLNDDSLRAIPNLHTNMAKLHAAGLQLRSLIRDILDPAKHDGRKEQDVRDLGVILRHAFRMPVWAILGYNAMLTENKAETVDRATEFLADLHRIEDATQRLFTQADMIATTGCLPVDQTIYKPSKELRVQLQTIVARFRSARHPRSQYAAAEKGKILVVDDDTANCDLLSRQLDRLGYSVTVAQNGIIALDLLSTQTFDLVLLDILMPVVSGIEVLKCLRCAWSIAELPVIMVTARDRNDDIVSALDCGANDYVAKPFSLPVVLARVRTQMMLKQTVADLENLNRKLEKLSLHDGLTNIPNRRCFNETFEREQLRTRRNGMPLSLILLDVDFFKRYNDTYGHEAGDQVLCRVADLLVSATDRGGDMVFRYGGEEFVILLPETPAAGARFVAERIHSAIQQLAIPHLTSTVAHHLTASMGIATATPSDKESYYTLFERADSQLYKVKASGRNSLRQSPD